LGDTLLESAEIARAAIRDGRALGKLGQLIAAGSRN